MNRQNLTISSWMNSVFDFKKFEKLIDISDINNNDVNEVIDDERYHQLNDKTTKTIDSLNNVYNAIKEIDHISEQNNYDSDWILSGRIELVCLLSLIDQLESNVSTLLHHVDTTNSDKAVNILDNLSKICKLNLLIKKKLEPYQMRLGILKQYLELEEEVLQSVQAELNYCVDKLMEINENKNLVKEVSLIKEMSLDDLKEKKIKVGLMNPINNHAGFILFSSIDVQIYDSYNTLYEQLLPISESLKLIPYALESLHRNARDYYSELVLDTLAKYEDIMSKYKKYRGELQQFREEYIISRNEKICERVFSLVDEEKSSTEVLEDVINLIKPIENFYGLDSQHVNRLRKMESRISNSSKDENNVPKTPVRSKSFSGKSKRVFSNPLADSLNMQPILSSVKSKRKEIKIFETPRHVDENILSEENRKIVEKIKTEIKQTLTDSKVNPLTSFTPMLSDDSFSSSNSSPDILRTKNIFDSPDPFITPNSRCYQRSRMPISTPLTTPRITPTRKFVMLPIDEEPSLRFQKCMGFDENSPESENCATQQPLLRYELSTVIKGAKKVEPTTVKAKVSPSSIPPSQIPLRSPKSRSNITSPVVASRIPLPKRPESRASMMRSVSKLQETREDSSSRNSNRSQIMPRSDSRLESIAMTMSAKLGTTSPTIPKLAMPRSSSVMTQREMRPYERSIQLGRLRASNMSQLRNIKARGVTSLGSRGNINGASRITSI